MNVYYTKKDYDEMKNRLSKQLKAANAKVEKLTAEVKKLKEDYAVLLETATEA